MDINFQGGKWVLHLDHGGIVNIFRIQNRQKNELHDQYTCSLVGTGLDLQFIVLSI
jgi:hypothetical protein